MVPHTTLPVSAQPNAGLPRRVAGRRFEYNIDGAYFARYARRLVGAGAALVGRGGGATPAQIQAPARTLAGGCPAAGTRPPQAGAPRGRAGGSATGDRGPRRYWVTTPTWTASGTSTRSGWSSWWPA